MDFMPNIIQAFCWGLGGSKWDDHYTPRIDFYDVKLIDFKGNVSSFIIKDRGSTELMGCVSVLRHRGLMQQIDQWESGRRQSAASAAVSIAMSVPGSAGYSSAGECQEPNDTASSLTRMVSLIS